MIEGHDPQRERGVAGLLKALEKSIPKLPAHAPCPVKLKRSRGERAECAALPSSPPLRLFR